MKHSGGRIPRAGRQGRMLLRSVIALIIHVKILTKVPAVGSKVSKNHFPLGTVSFTTLFGFSFGC